MGTSTWGRLVKYRVLEIAIAIIILLFGNDIYGRYLKEAAWQAYLVAALAATLVALVVVASELARARGRFRRANATGMDPRGGLVRSFSLGLQFWLDKLTDTAQLLGFNDEGAHDEEIRENIRGVYDTCLRYCHDLLATGTMHITGCVLAVRNDEFIPRAHIEQGLRNRRLRGFHRPIADGLEGFALSTQSVQYCDNLEQDSSRYMHIDALDFNPKCQIAIPILVSDRRSVGVMSLYGDQPVSPQTIEELEFVFHRVGQILGLGAVLDREWETPGA
ncbi:MAG TPA: GAF domain-containing protein [Armatimonadota bacterium]|nr:GAF domain-containing protein [Armatimonadota bacterium]